MSRISARSEEVTDLSLSGLDDVYGPVVACNRTIADHGGCGAVLIDDACLQQCEHNER